MRTLNICFMATSALALSAACERPGPVFLSATSPGGQYVIRLSGRPDRVQMPFLHWVRADVLRGDDVILRGWRIHTTGRLADGFSDRYPSHSWTRQNIWQLSPSDHTSHVPTDIVFIRNESHRRVRALRVQAHDLFLVVDWPARRSGPVTTTGPVHWIAVEGVWEDGSSLGKVDAHFDASPGQRSEYSVVLREGAVTVHRRPL
jgi:hypothetical protein